MHFWGAISAGGVLGSGGRTGTAVWRAGHTGGLGEAAAATAGSGVIVALLHHLAGVQLAESVLEIGEGAFCLADLGVVSAEDIGVAGGLTEVLGGLEELALGLDALVDILDLLVQLVRLGRDGMSGGGDGMDGRRTIVEGE